MSDIISEVRFRPGVTNLIETESHFLVQIHAKGYQFDTHTSEIKICSICLQLCYSGNRLIHPRLMQPPAYYIQIAWHGIFLILSHDKNPG